jgi:hypothetical protein
MEEPPPRGRRKHPETMSQAMNLDDYSDEFKNSILAKMLPPNNISVPQLVAGFRSHLFLNRSLCSS